jgi:hypothetical protein
MLEISGKGGYDPLKITVPICARRLLVEVCTLEEQEDLTVTVV